MHAASFPRDRKWNFGGDFDAARKTISVQRLRFSRKSMKSSNLVRQRLACIGPLEFLPTYIGRFNV